MSDPRAPSGEQIEIAAGDQAAVIAEVGGGLRSYEVGALALVDGFGPGDMSTASRGKLLIPWPNRIRDGRYEFEGEEHQLPIDEVALGNAIHGLARWATWHVGEREPDRVVMRHSIDARPGYPFSLAVEAEYALSADGLQVTISATNLGARTCPFGCGAHPYLTLGTPTIDALTLELPAGTVLLADEHAIPIGREAVERTEHDFRRPRPLAGVRLDHAFTDLERGSDGRARVVVRGDERAVALWVDEAYGYLMVFTGDVPDVARGGLAVEPMTCPPNAFRTGEALIRLEPGGTFSGSWGIGPA